MNYLTSKVRVGGQLYHLTMDESKLRLDLAAGGVEPYEYPYDVIQSAKAIVNGYYEPCIEVTVCYNLNETASMTMTFDFDEERDNVLRQLLSVTGNKGGGYQQAPQYGGGYGNDPGYSDNYGQNSQQYPGNGTQYPNGQPYNEYSDENTDVYGANRSGGYGGYNDGMSGYGSEGGYGNGGYGNEGYGNEGYGNGYQDGYSQNNSGNYSNYSDNHSNNYSDNYSDNYGNNGSNYSGNYRDDYSENYPGKYSDSYSDRYSDGYGDYDRYGGRGSRGDEYERGYDSDYGSSYDSGRQSFGEYKYSQGSLTLPEKIIGFIRYPSETFESSSSDSTVSVLIYGILMLVLFSVVNVVIAAVIGSAVAPKNAIFGALLSNGGELVRLILEYLIFSIICVLVYGILVFLLTKITGQGLSLPESLGTTIYSTTALGTIGLIPLVGIFIAPLFLIFLQIKGLMAGYIQDTKFAVIAAVVPAIVMFAVFYYVVISGEVAFI